MIPLWMLCWIISSDTEWWNKFDFTACLSIRLKLTLAKKSTVPYNMTGIMLTGCSPINAVGNGTNESQKSRRLLYHSMALSVFSILWKNWWWFTQNIATIKKLMAKLKNFGERCSNSFKTSWAEKFSGRTGTRSSSTSSVTTIANTPSLNASILFVPGVYSLILFSKIIFKNNTYCKSKM